MWQPTNWFAETELRYILKKNDDGIFFRATGGNKTRKRNFAGQRALNFNQLTSYSFLAVPLGYWLQRFSSALTTKYIDV